MCIFLAILSKRTIFPMQKKAQYTYIFCYAPWSAFPTNKWLL